MVDDRRPPFATRRWFALALAGSGLLVAGCGSAPAAARFVLGRWHGELHQSNYPPFQVTVSIGSLSASAANHVYYSRIDCSGHWTYLGVSGAKVRFREVIDHGKSATCTGVGEITLVRQGAQLRYQFTAPGEVSRAVLSRG
jgi:hypothetical protein